MATYYVNKQAQSNGDHEVHKSGCTHMPSEENKRYLGSFDNCHDAVREAKKYYAVNVKDFSYLLGKEISQCFGKQFSHFSASRK